ncbi:hypothetical protein LINGRAHAP2_LOCUS13097 [Linum grandiflorum]
MELFYQIDIVGILSTSGRCSIVVSIPACHAGDLGSIPGNGVSIFFPLFSFIFIYAASSLRSELWFFLLLQFIAVNLLVDSAFLHNRSISESILQVRHCPTNLPLFKNAIIAGTDLEKTITTSPSAFITILDSYPAHYYPRASNLYSPEFPPFLGQNLRCVAIIIRNNAKRRWTLQQQASIQTTQSSLVPWKPPNLCCQIMITLVLRYEAAPKILTFRFVEEFKVLLLMSVMTFVCPFLIAHQTESDEKPPFQIFDLVCNGEKEKGEGRGRDKRNKRGSG